MANIANILGGAFVPPVEKYVAPAEDQLRQAMQEAGIEPPDQIILDGKLRRFRSGTKGQGGHGDKTGWYVCFNDGVPAGRFGCWRAGVEVTFKANVGRKLDMHEEMAIQRRMSEAKKQREIEEKKSREVASDTVSKIWSDAAHAEADHPYLKRKGIQPNGARITGDGRLIVPLYNEDNTLSTLQYISYDGDKKYHPGGATGGKFNIIGTVEDAKTVYIAEGFATAATIHEVTGQPCIAAYSASNLVPVAGRFKELLGALADIVIVADHDESGVGMRYAEQASAKYGVRVVVPPQLGDANDYYVAGGDLSLLLNPPHNDWLVSADDFSKQPAPIKWLIKHWFQQDALIMVHGPSGGGKTFVVLDAAMRIASGLEVWANKHKVKPGTVVYLAGEGHHGLRSRVAAWKHHNNVNKMNMWLSKSGCDLNTPQGYQQSIDNIKHLKEAPVLIIVDTLHRFLMGDENSAQDAKTMLDACGGLMREFNCSVLLVHHTGVSDESQHRARGSSAWKGALDIEISVVPGKDGKPMEVVQRKTKDSEMSPNEYFNLKSVEIPGWFDEDGEPVTSAVIEVADAPEKQTNDPAAKWKGIFERAWFASGAEFQFGGPYVSKSALRTFLEKNLGYSQSTTEAHLKTKGTKGKMMNELFLCNFVDKTEHGYVVIDDVYVSAMSLKHKA